MKEIEKLVLLEGVFSSDDANEVLTELFKSKLNWHKIQNWSSQERFGKDDELSQSRIVALTNEIDKLRKLLSEAKENNNKLLVNSEVVIRVLEN